MNPQIAAMARARAQYRTGQAYGGPVPNYCAPTYMSPGECPPPGCNVPLAEALGRVQAGSGGRCREIALGLADTAVGIGATVTLTATAQATMCPNRMIIVGGAGQDGFRITAMTVGTVPMFLGTELHSQMFSPDAVQAIPFKMDCLTAGITVSITVVNLDAAAQGIWVALVGPAQY